MTSGKTDVDRKIRQQQKSPEETVLPGSESDSDSFLGRFFNRFIPADQSNTLDWQENAHRAYIEQEPVKANLVLYLMALTVVLLLAWSAIATVDEVTRGNGKVIPSQKVQVIQSQDGGKVTEILAKEGDVVNKGQLLISLDQTRSLSEQRKIQSELDALDVKATRLRALAEGKPFEPLPAWRNTISGVVEQEQLLYQSNIAQMENEKTIFAEQLDQRKQELNEANSKRQQSYISLQLTRQEMAVTEPMVASGAVSEVELLRLKRNVNELRGEHQQAGAQIARIESAIIEAQRKLENVELTFINQVREELTKTLAQANSLRESLTGLSDRTAETEIRSPVRGTVKQLFFNTIGGVVLPGHEIIEIIPLDDTLLLEARIKPQDIAFLVPGQKAKVKFTAYDFVVYGGLEGMVEQIGVDTVTDENGEPYYPVLVRTTEASLGDGKPIIPGMTAVIDILTGEKTILAYILKPVLRAKEYALTER